MFIQIAENSPAFCFAIDDLLLQLFRHTDDIPLLLHYLFLAAYYTIMSALAGFPLPDFAGFTFFCTKRFAFFALDMIKYA